MRFFKSLVLLFLGSIAVAQTPPQNPTQPTTAAVPADCDGLQKFIRDKIAASKSCDQDKDCASAAFDCPFGCESIVRVADIRELTKLSQQYHGACPACTYDCYAPPAPIRCLNHQCVKMTEQMFEAEMGTLDTKDCKAEQKRIHHEAAKARACKEDAECVISPLASPFQCNELVNKMERTRLEAIYLRFKKACAQGEHSCPPPIGQPKCLRDHCVWKD